MSRINPASKRLSSCLVSTTLLRPSSLSASCTADDHLPEVRAAVEMGECCSRVDVVAGAVDHGLDAGDVDRLGYVYERLAAANRDVPEARAAHE